MPDGHHHHIICTNCNRVIEFENCGLDHLRRELEARYHVQLTGHLLEFYGLCDDCMDAVNVDKSAETAGVLMHVVYNGWFWDQPNTGSGQVIRHLLPALRRVITRPADDARAAAGS